VSIEPREGGILLTEEHIEHGDPISMIARIGALLHLIHQAPRSRAFTAAPIHLSEEGQRADVIGR